MENNFLFHISKEGQERILDLLYDQSNKTNFRIYVRGGGCSGFRYGFMLDETKNDDDFEVAVGPFCVVIDAASLQYITGATLDYKTEGLNSQFVIENPNASITCGCGASFTV